MRGLATLNSERMLEFQDFPTLKELGYNLVNNSPFGLAGPKGMDPKVVKILHDALVSGIEGNDQHELWRCSKDFSPFLNGQDAAVICQGMDNHGGVFAGLNDVNASFLIGYPRKFE
jgi:tripartite-type tricarboxylate transporter receptor subunit TctC